MSVSVIEHVAGRGTSRRPTRRPGVVTALRCAAGLVTAIAAWWLGVLGETGSRDLLAGVTLLVLPLDVLPAIVVILVRDGSHAFGSLSPSDVAALVYLARLALSPRLFALRITAPRLVLIVFLLWAAFVTYNGYGLLTSLSRIAVYAAVGVAVTCRVRGDAWLRAAVVGLSLTEIALYLPHVPDRLRGVIIDDPAHAGVLFLAALLVVAASRAPSAVKGLLGVVLVFGVAMTLTRAVWFALAVVALAALLPRRWYVPLLMPPLLALAAMPLVPWITGQFGLNARSAGLRLQGFTAGWSEFIERPLTGHGWAYAASAKEAGLVGVDTTAIYNVWLYVAACTGLVGLALFVVYVALLSRAAVRHTVPYLFLTGVLAMSLTEMHLYGVSLVAVLFFTMTSAAATSATGKGPATDSPAAPVSPECDPRRGYCR